MLFFILFIIITITVIIIIIFVEILNVVEGKTEKTEKSILASAALEYLSRQRKVTLVWAAALADAGDELLKSVGWDPLSSAFYDEHGMCGICTLCCIFCTSFYTLINFYFVI